MEIKHPTMQLQPGLRRLWEEVFGDSDDFLDRFFSVAFAPDRCLCALDGDRVAAALYWMPCSRGEDPLAYLYAVATHPDYRGRGLCRNLIEGAHRLMKQQGYVGALLYPQESSLQQMYEKMGYRTVTAVSERSVFAGEAAGDYRELTPEEYSRIRGAWLPENAVQQGSPFPELLGGRFFLGEDFLMACREYGGNFFGLEVLGPGTGVPGLLSRLGYSWALLRTPGEEIPFAMFCPLAPDVRPPAYFGLPVD